MAIAVGDRIGRCVLSTILFLVLSSPRILAAGPTGGGAAGDEIAVGHEQQQMVAVTIYNDDLALIKDRRQVNMPAGLNSLAFREVSARIRPETALLRSLTHPGGFSLIEQNFDFDLLTPRKLLEKYVGRQVRIIRTHPQTGEETSLDAEVLAANNGVVLRVGDRIETGIPGRLVFPQVPENLRDRPTLVTLLNSGSDQPQQLELSYLTGGLSWQADYVAELGADDETIDLSGWVTLTNQSGTSYQDARMRLVAGDLHRVRQELRRGDMMVEETMVRAAEPRLREEGLFEYHLYTLDRPTTIRENQTKQVALLSAADIDIVKEFVLQGADFYYRRNYGELGENLKVGVFVEFVNREESGLGMPLPKGTIRVYKQDSSGHALFVGEDRIDHTPKNETVRLKLGEAFDVTASRKQTDFQKLEGSGPYNYVFESAYRIELKNAKEESVTVKVLEPMPGDWEVIEQSHPHIKEAADTAAWSVRVPGEGRTVLEYRVRVRY